MNPTRQDIHLDTRMYPDPRSRDRRDVLYEVMNSVRTVSRSELRGCITRPLEQGDWEHLGSGGAVAWCGCKPGMAALYSTHRDD